MSEYNGNHFSPLPPHDPNAPMTLAGTVACVIVIIVIVVIVLYAWLKSRKPEWERKAI